MKRMKKVFAMFLAFAMVMGMSLTSFAASTDKGSIKVNGLDADEATTVKLYQVISHNEAASRWEVASWATGLIDVSENPATIDWAKLEEKVEKENIKETVAYTTTETDSVYETNHRFTDLAIGAYLILATGSSSTYVPMGAAIYTYGEDGLITAPAQDVEVYAKYENTVIKKELASSSEGKDEFVGRGDEVSFDITATFPSFYDENGDATSGTFTIVDAPTGLDIDTESVVVTVGGVEVDLTDDYTVTEDKDGKVTVTFTSTFINDNNENAGKKVVVSLTAIVTSEDGYSNTANSSNSDSHPEVKGYSGALVITKKNNEDEVLTGAEFTLSKLTGTVKNEDGTTTNTYSDPIYFVLKEVGVYKVALESEQGATTKLVATNGTLRLEGLDEGTYHITETKAPQGYSINENITDVTIVRDTKAVAVPTTVVDTKLSALPSTGGIGTAVFTIGGCAIMIAAAYFFFVSRKKES